MVTNEDRLAGLFQLMIGASMISFSGVFVKLAHVGPTTAGFYRVVFGGVILLLLVLIRGDGLWKRGASWGHAMLCGLFFAMDLTFWHRSVHALGPGLATLLANFQVFFLACFGMIFLAERASIRFFFSIPLSLLGLFLIVGLNWGELGVAQKDGILFGLAAAACYATMILTLRRAELRGTFPSPAANLCVISLVTSLVLGMESWGWGEGFGIPDLQSLGALVAYGLVSQVLGWIFISMGIVRVEVSRAGLILLLQPTLAFVWDVALFGRAFTATDGVGALLALSGIYLGATASGAGRPKGVRGAS